MKNDAYQGPGHEPGGDEESNSSSDIRHPTSNIHHPVSDPQHPTTIHGPTSVIQHLSSGMPHHFEWVDSVKGIAILWIVFFHCLIAYGGTFPWLVTLGNFWTFVEECAPASLTGKFSCAIEAVIAGIVQRGPHGVGVFLLFSGFGLAYSLFRHNGEPAWGSWYLRRVTRLFPIYWLAHLFFLVSPIQYKPDPIDFRFVLSFLGDRIYPIDKLFFYMNPSWWFFGLLLELYIVFPFLFRLLKRLGAVKFGAFCLVVTWVTRYALTAAGFDGRWGMGGFFGPRLWEFGAGMVLAKLLAENPERTLKQLFSGKFLVLGIVLYIVGLFTYRPDFFIIFSDCLVVGIVLILIHVAAAVNKVPWAGKALVTIGVYSYSIYLFHQPLVMYAGDRLQSFGFFGYFFLAVPVIAVVAAGAMCFEYAVNRLLAKLQAG